MASKNETTLARSIVLDADALNETKSLEELAELVQHADRPQTTASDTGAGTDADTDTDTDTDEHLTSSAATPAGRMVADSEGNWGWKFLSDGGKFLRDSTTRIRKLFANEKLTLKESDANEK